MRNRERWIFENSESLFNRKFTTKNIFSKTSNFKNILISVCKWNKKKLKIWFKKMCLIGQKFFLEIIIGKAFIGFFQKHEKISDYCSNRRAENLLRQEFRKLIKFGDQ